jgi:hypothetical protein
VRFVLAFMGKLADYGDTVGAYAEHYEGINLEFLRGLIPDSRFEYGIEQMMVTRDTSLSGEARIHGFMSLISNGLYNKPHHFQDQLVHNALGSLAVLLAKDEWHFIGPSINNNYEIKSNNPFNLISAGRRMGKSEGCAMVMIGVAYYHPGGVKQAVFAQSMRIAKELCDSIVRLLENSNYGHWILSIKQEELILLNVDGRESVINFYPCSPKVRGVSVCCGSRSNRSFRQGLRAVAVAA